MSVTGDFIDQCEQEQLHLSGAIQPHGALLVCDSQNRITHVSQNIEPWLGKSANDLLGSSLPAELTPIVFNLGNAPGSRLTRFHAPLENIGASLIATRAADNTIVIELIPSQSSEPKPHYPRVHRFAGFQSIEELEQAREQLVSHIQRESGFARVMYYQFRHDGTGEVKAEAKAPQATGSYLGLRFPASDIPQIARQLYIKAPWRSIPDTMAESVNILSREQAPPDLSFADLRSVSPVHQSYMSNMGVASSVSVPLVLAGKLKALISCHSDSPRRLVLPELAALAEQVNSFALSAKEFRTRQRMNLLSYLDTRLEQWHGAIANAGDLGAAWGELGEWMLAEFDAHGVLLDTGEHRLQAGVVPEADAMAAIEHWSRDAGNDSAVKISDHLGDDCPDLPLTEIAGALAVTVALPGKPSVSGFLFRAEEIYEVPWGGQPDKPVENLNSPHPIAPRQSFERWVETRVGYSREWPDNTRIKLFKLREFLAELSQ